MTALAPIGPPRVAAIRPVQPGPTDDPSEDGLDIEAVTEPTMVPVTDQINPTESAGDAQLDLSRRALSANAATTVANIVAFDPARMPASGARGNTAVATGFDQRPASDLGHAPRGEFASPFARAMSSYAGR